MKSTHVASGSWQVRPGEEDAFRQRWEEFLGWTRDSHPDLELARLVQSDDDPHWFVSFAGWSSPEARSAWKSSEGFALRFKACRELCDEFRGGDFEVVAAF